MIRAYVYLLIFVFILSQRTYIYEYIFKNTYTCIHTRSQQTINMRTLARTRRHAQRYNAINAHTRIYAIHLHTERHMGHKKRCAMARGLCWKRAAYWKGREGTFMRWACRECSYISALH